MKTSRPRFGLALAGGGPLGAVYEIGALCALDEAITGLDLTALDGYVGVSAGGFVAAGLANGMSPRQLCSAFIETGAARGVAGVASDTSDTIDPTLFLRPAWAELARRSRSLPGLVMQAFWQAARSGAGRGSSAKKNTRTSPSSGSLLRAVERLGRALPTGIFSSAPLEKALALMFSAPGRSNDFRQLSKRLVLVATDLDSGDAAPFGLPGWDHVPISRAIAASAALPGLYPPVNIDGRWYVDGALKKTLHASVLLDMGLDLVICLNPLVPFDASRPQRHRVGGAAQTAIPQLVDGGLPVVLSQTFRSLIHSRLELGIKGYQSSHPQTDLLLFEPDHRDPELFLANIFSYAQRQGLAEHAYQRTRADLRSRRGVLRARLRKHGLDLNDAVLDDTRRGLLQPGKPTKRRSNQTLQRLDEVLNDLERSLALRPAAGVHAAR